MFTMFNRIKKHDYLTMLGTILGATDEIRKLDGMFLSFRLESLHQSCPEKLGGILMTLKVLKNLENCSRYPRTV